MKTTHTHKGHCQVCGAMHAVDNSHNGLAKHGYDVSYGFFNGTCSGADNLPIQLDRTIADKTVDQLKLQIIDMNDQLATNGEWTPETVYGYMLDGKNVSLLRRSNFFSLTDGIHAMKYEKYNTDYHRMIAQGYTTVEYTFDEFASIVSEVSYENAERLVDSWRQTRARRFNNVIKMSEAHIYFLQDLVEKFHGQPLIESNLVSKVVKELSDIASADIVNEVATIEIKTSWDGREYKNQRFFVWESEAEKEVNGKTLKVVCKRNKTYKKYSAYTYLDGKKVGKKVLEEMIG